jgi:hypothetical protein
MTPKKLTIERTAAGLQYVLPGAERRLPPKPLTYLREGARLVIPGAERISDRELAACLAAKPFSPRVRQRSLRGTGLFKRDER